MAMPRNPKPPVGVSRGILEPIEYRRTVSLVFHAVDRQRAGAVGQRRNYTALAHGAGALTVGEVNVGSVRKCGSNGRQVHTLLGWEGSDSPQVRPHEGNHVDLERSI